MQWSGSPEPVPDPAKWDTITYKYDHSGRRIEKSGNGEAIRYCYDGDHVVAEYDGNDRLLRRENNGDSHLFFVLTYVAFLVKLLACQD